MLISGVMSCFPIWFSEGRVIPEVYAGMMRESVRRYNRISLVKFSLAIVNALCQRTLTKIRTKKFCALNLEPN